MKPNTFEIQGFADNLMALEMNLEPKGLDSSAGQFAMRSKTLVILETSSKFARQ